MTEHYIKRELESVLARAAIQFPAVVLTGPRQSGKTTLLKHMFSRTHDYVSLEPPDVRAAALADPRGFLRMHAPPVIMDEVQYAPDLLPYIKERIDAHRSEVGQYLLTGSQNLLLIDRVTESLAGRTAMLRLLPLSWRESKGHAGIPLVWEDEAALRTGDAVEPAELWRSILLGGYPELVASPNRDATLWHASYVQTYLERDVRSLRQVGDLASFQSFLRALAARNGQLLKLSELARDLGIAVNTAKGWLSVLEASFQVIVLRPYFANAGKRLVRTPKVYFTDTGTLCYLVGLRDASHAAAGPMGGPLFETAVLMEIVKAFVHRGEEPPVYFWLVAASFKLSGLSEASARFSSALAALGTMLFVWFLARRMFGDSAGFYAGIIFATSPLVVIFAREVIFDMTLTFFVTVAMVCYWLGEASAGGRKILDVLFFAAMGVATLTKGPVGFLLPILSIVAYQACRGSLRNLKKLNWGLGLAVFLAVTLPWFIAVSVRHPDFPRYAFWEESLERFATGHSHRAGPVYYYLLIYLAGFLPWSFFLLYAVYGRIKRWKELRQEQNAPVLFLLSWAGVILIFFSVSRSKLPGYFLPAIIPLSILAGMVWTERGSQQERRAPDWLTAGFATLIALGIIAALVPQLERFAFLHARLDRKLPSSLLPLLKPSLIYTGIILGALGIIGRDLCARAREKAPTLVIFLLAACTFPLLLVRWFHPLEIYASADSSRNLARSILTSPGKDVPVYGYYYFRTSLPFYLRRPVGLISANADELTSNYIVSRWRKVNGQGQGGSPPSNVFTAGTGGTPLVMSEKQWLSERWSTPVFVLIRDNRVPQLAAAVRRMDPLWTGWKYSVWEIPADSDEQSPPAPHP